MILFYEWFNNIAERSYFMVLDDRMINEE